jgi:phage baseplate assembly protein gpV
MKMRIVKKEDEYTRNPFYIATVEDNADPNNSYRVKVRIPEVHPESITTEELPWAGKVDMSFMGTGDTQDIHHSIPEVGTQVLVLAIQNNINSLIYLGCLYRKTPQTPEGEQYGGTYGVYRKDGQFIGVDKITSIFKMLFDGDIEVDRVNNIKIKAKNEINIECSMANITAKNDINVKCNNATLVADKNINAECNNATVKVKETAKLDCKNANLTAKENVNVDCKTSNIKASSNINIDSPKTNISGDVGVNGNISTTGNMSISGSTDIGGNTTISGNTTVSGSVSTSKINAINYNSHTHLCTTLGAPTRGPSS